MEQLFQNQAMLSFVLLSIALPLSDKEQFVYKFSGGIFLILFVFMTKKAWKTRQTVNRLSKKKKAVSLCLWEIYGATIENSKRKINKDSKEIKKWIYDAKSHMNDACDDFEKRRFEAAGIGQSRELEHKINYLEHLMDNLN